METIKELGRQIRRKRLAMNYSMDYAANQAGITRATLSSIENGFSNVSIKNLIRLLNVLDMSLTLTNDKSESERKRASRRITSFEKKINRFVNMCIEQYASKTKTDNTIIYKQMKENNIIKELEDDYEDLHGMSVEYLNYYIEERLKK